jgi:hypothetical protein
MQVEDEVKDRVVLEDEGIEIEIFDDTPPEDRGRKPAAPLDDEPDEDQELASYSEGVQKRIKKLSKGYHDERRVKEAAIREKEAAIDFAQRAIARNRELEQQLSAGSEVFIETSKSEAALALAAAKKDYKEAYEAGDSDKLVEAQERIARAVAATDRVKELKPLTVTEEKGYSQPQESYSVPEPSDRDNDWLSENPWFDLHSDKLDEEMRGAALGLHEKIAREGKVQISSDKYYELINARMRKIFPEYFGTESPNDRDSKSNRVRQNTVVAPASRSTAPRKIKLTETQVNLAKRLGVPLEAYAKQVALEQNGDR